jgi:hypothetical protein
MTFSLLICSVADESLVKAPFPATERIKTDPVAIESGRLWPGKCTLPHYWAVVAVRRADRAYVFEDGRVSEEDHHEALIARIGLYAQLYGERQS